MGIFEEKAFMLAVPLLRLTPPKSPLNVREARLARRTNSLAGGGVMKSPPHVSSPLMGED